MAVEFLYTGTCANCGDQFNLSYGVGRPLNNPPKSIKCSDCGEMIKPSAIKKKTIKKDKKIKIEDVPVVT